MPMPIGNGFGRKLGNFLRRLGSKDLVVFSETQNGLTKTIPWTENPEK